eukprot:TRINITY_DN587_c0_g1_i3.p1 TRINITY_DN587_c0_g1~~TRINITY_DN587_c0_g1_i3.p1  ORF type:complete len:105 (+),score=12.41 TRINITY_DN587_c0_g1_i3:618-932(+)
MLIAPSKLPGRNPNPFPISAYSKSPSTSLSTAMLSIHLLTSMPTHSCPLSLSTQPLIPEPQPMSSMSAFLSAGKARISRARSVSLVWTSMMCVLLEYFSASFSL